MKLSDQTIKRVEKRAEDLGKLYELYRLLQELAPMIDKARSIESNIELQVDNELKNYYFAVLQRIKLLTKKDNETESDFTAQNFKKHMDLDELCKIAKAHGIDFTEGDYLSKTDKNSSAYTTKPDDYKAIAALFMPKLRSAMGQVPATPFQKNLRRGLCALIVGLIIPLAMGEMPKSIVQLSAIAIICALGGLLVIAAEIEDSEKLMSSITTEKVGAVNANIESMKEASKVPADITATVRPSIIAGQFGNLGNGDSDLTVPGVGATTTSQLTIN